MVVFWALNDSLTRASFRAGAQDDVANVLRAVHESGVSYQTIEARASFALVDKYGNSTEATVLRASYNRSTVARINWAAFLPKNPFDIADSLWLHPSMR